jgi:hypothetical protein
MGYVLNTDVIASAANQSGMAANAPSPAFWIASALRASQ